MLKRETEVQLGSSNHSRQRTLLSLAQLELSFVNSLRQQSSSWARKFRKIVGYTPYSGYQARRESFGRHLVSVLNVFNVWAVESLHMCCIRSDCT